MNAQIIGQPPGAEKPVSPIVPVARRYLNKTAKRATSAAANPIAVVIMFIWIGKIHKKT
jgi:hypothetical protein